MGDQLDNRPTFTIVMGCNGAGKSHWKRNNYDELPIRFLDLDSIAGGLGDWNEEENRAEALTLTDQFIDEALADRSSFGVESTYSGKRGRDQVARMMDAGYRIEGVYIGINNPTIHIERIAKRVDLATGHWIDPARIPERYRHSLSNLRKTAEWFDELVIVDNSTEHDVGYIEPVQQACLERGKIVRVTDEPVEWFKDWLQRFQDRQQSLARAEEKRARGMGR